MPRAYTVEFDGVTWTNGQGDIDIFSILPATQKPLELVAIEIAQSSELQEAQEEQLRLRTIRGHTTVGSGGAAATARPTSPNDSAAGATCRTNDTTIASAGTGVNLWSTSFNVRVGYAWGPVPAGLGIWVANAEYLVVRLMAAVTDDIVASGTCAFIEYP